MIPGATRLARAVDGETVSEALYSDCGLFRYRLTRRWSDAGPVICWIMLNPSTATELRNDPTIERCERRSRAMGAGGLEVVNLFAYRATHPRDLFAAADPVGPGNDRIVSESAGAAGRVVCGWGAHGEYQGRGAAMAAALRQDGRRLTALGLTKGGEPRHPLYVAYRVQPEDWE